MRLSRLEQETIIRRSAADQEWDIYSDDPAIQRKLERCGWAGEPQGEFGRRYLVPRAAITIRSRSGLENLKAAAKGRKLRCSSRPSSAETDTAA